MIIIPANTLSTGGFDVANSCRFNAPDDAYMHKTPGSSGSRRIGTFSIWVKLALNTPEGQYLFSGSPDATTETSLGLSIDGDDLRFNGWTSNVEHMLLVTDRKFRDASAFYNIVVAWDTTQGTASNRVKIYVNGVQETSFSTETYPDQDRDLNINNASNKTLIGARSSANYAFGDGYYSEVVMIDGTQLDATSFGEFDEDSGIWKPIDVSGLTFGTNGFYLDFEDSANLGNDANGGTDFTEVNLAATDQSTDTCTNNFNTPNPLYGMQAIRVPVFAEGNLKITGDGDANHHQTMGTFAVNKGKWFWEAKYTVSADIGKNKIGIMSTELGTPQTAELGDQSGSCLYINEDGGDFRRDNATVDQNAGECSLNQIVSVALNMDDGEISIYRAGSLIVDALDIGNAAGTYVTPASMHYRDAGMEFNFGSPPYSESGGNSDGNGYGNYSMSVPSGYYSWNTKNLSEFG